MISRIFLILILISKFLISDEKNLVFAWGYNSHGELGIGKYSSAISYPVKVKNIKDIKIISASPSHSLALKADGTIWAWGWNEDGELGNGTNENSNIPVQVLNLKDVIAISAGYPHSLALKIDRTVWAWGGNEYGQLGNGTNENSNIPVKVQNLTDVIEISAGCDHSLALKADGTVWAWGNNYHGELGNGTNIDSNIPVQVLNLTNIIAIAAGGNHSLALKADGTVWAWGSSHYGQLGNGTTKDSNIPLQVQNINNIIKISAGGTYSLGLKSDGTVWEWGVQASFFPSYNKTRQKLFPTKIESLKNIIDISCGACHSFALEGNGTLWGWGDNQQGQIGNGRYSLLLAYEHEPVKVVYLSGVKSISAGGAHSLAIGNSYHTCNYIIPAAAHSPGAYGSFWKTDLEVCNYSGDDVEINIDILRSDMDNSEHYSTGDTFYNNECIEIKDAFTLLGYEGTGAIVVCGSWPYKVAEGITVRSRTYNDSEGGTYGQFIPGINEGELLEKDEVGYLTYLKKGENFRTNIGFASISEKETIIHIEIYKEKGEKIGEKDIYLYPYGHRQENDIFEQFGIEEISSAYIKVKSQTEDAKYTGYASIIDNRTNDPIFVPISR